MRTKTYFLMTVLLVSVLLSGCAGAAFAQTTAPTDGSESQGPATRTLSVNASGKAFLSPDIAYVNIGVHTEDKNAEEAMAANNSRSLKVIEAIQDLGVDEKDIQTSNFSIYPQQEYDANGKPTGEINYIVDNTVHVTVRDLEKIGELLDASVKAGANTINNIQFDVADKSKALSEARQAAVEAARAKASELAEAAGVTLGEVQTINESSNDYPGPLYSMRSGVSTAQEAAAAPISTGQMTIAVDVNVVYEIR